MHMLHSLGSILWWIPFRLDWNMPYPEVEEHLEGTTP